MEWLRLLNPCDNFPNHNGPIPERNALCYMLHLPEVARMLHPWNQRLDPKKRLLTTRLDET